MNVSYNQGQVLTFIYFNESPLKPMNSAFYFTLKDLLILEIFTFLSWFFGYAEKRLVKKAMVNCKIYVTDWTTNNYNRHVAQYFKKYIFQLSGWQWNLVF